MNNLNSFIIILTVTITTSCYNPKRNKIVFQSNIQNVQDSLLKMEGFLEKLPQRADSLNINYTIKDGKLFVNNSLFDNNFIRDSKISFTNSEKTNFISLAFYLNKNYLSAAYFDEPSELWRFLYRHAPEDGFDDVRDIVLIDSPNDLSNLALDTILNQNGKVFLLAPKDAKIQ